MITRPEVRGQATVHTRVQAGVRDHGTGDAGGAHPQRMDTDWSA